MRKIFKLKIFWLVFIISTGVIFAALISLNQIYKSETEFLIVPKSQSAALTSDQIIENLRALPYTLSFFNRMIEDNPEVADEAVAEMTSYRKKAYWEKKVDVRRNGESGILKIVVSDKSRYQSQILASQVSQSLIKSVSLFYDIKKDVNVRIIDGPITVSATSFSRFILLLESLIAGFALVFFSFFISFSFFGGEKQKEVPEPKTLSWYRKKSAENVSAFSREKSWDFEKKTRRDFAKKAAAPDNLPIAPDFSVEGKETPEIIEEKEEEMPKEKKPIIREATPEEVKERLNKLLSGKL